MACREHWKSCRVLPMFRAHPLATDPGIPGDARPNAARSARQEMPAMDEVIRAKRQSPSGSGMRAITIRGAREHNLKNVDLEIPRDRLVVFTGPSRAGKPPLPFATIYSDEP